MSLQNSGVVVENKLLEKLLKWIDPNFQSLVQNTSRIRTLKKKKKKKKKKLRPPYFTKTSDAKKKIKISESCCVLNAIVMPEISFTKIWSIIHTWLACFRNWTLQTTDNNKNKKQKQKLMNNLLQLQFQKVLQPLIDKETTHPPTHPPKKRKRKKESITKIKEGTVNELSDLPV